MPKAEAGQIDFRQQPTVSNTSSASQSAETIPVTQRLIDVSHVNTWNTEKRPAGRILVHNDCHAKNPDVEFGAVPAGDGMPLRAGARQLGGREGSCTGEQADGCLQAAAGRSLRHAARRRLCDYL